MDRAKFWLSISAGIALMAVSSAALATNKNYPYEWVDFKGAQSNGIAMSGYTLLWADEFNDGQSVIRNETTKAVVGKPNWLTRVHAPLGVGVMALADDPAMKIEKGILRLTNSQDKSGKWTDTHLQTMDSKGAGFAIKNGLITARIKLPKQNGHDSAFWLLSMNDPAYGHGEIDVLESYGRGDARGHHMTVHWWPPVTGVNRSRFPKHVSNSNYIGTDNLQGVYHTFSAELTPEWIYMYLDDKRISAIKRLPEQRVPFYLLLSNFAPSNLTNRDPDPSVMEVDYVRVYAPNAHANWLGANPSAACKLSPKDC